MCYVQERAHGLGVFNQVLYAVRGCALPTYRLHNMTQAALQTMNHFL